MNKKIVLSFLMMLSLSSYGDIKQMDTQCGDFPCPSGNINENNKLLENEIYTMSYDIKNKMPDWAYYSFDAKYFSNKGKRVWKTNPNLKEEEQLKPKDYKSAYAELKTDRGHFVPLYTYADHPNYKILNYLTNISPQKFRLNRGKWLQIEKFERSLINMPGVVRIHVFTGSYYDDTLNMRLPKSKKDHDIPDGYWKIIIAEDENNKYGYVSYLIKQVPKIKGKFCKFENTLENIRLKGDMNFDIEDLVDNSLTTKVRKFALKRCK